MVKIAVIVLIVAGAFGLFYGTFRYTEKVSECLVTTGDCPHNSRS